MNIKGKRVVLRAIQKEDNALLLEMLNDEEIEKRLGGWSFPVSMEQQEKWFEGLGYREDMLRCMIEASGESIGTAILSDIDMKNGTAEIHIKIGKKEYRGAGYGQEVINLLTKYGFQELRLHCIYAQVLEENMGSRKMFGACGFEEEGILKERLYKEGRYRNIVAYSKRNERQGNGFDERNRQ